MIDSHNGNYIFLSLNKETGRVDCKDVSCYAVVRENKNIKTEKEGRDAFNVIPEKFQGLVKNLYKNIIPINS